MYRPNEQLRKRIETLNLTVPLFLSLAVLGYQLIFARWVHQTYGSNMHYAIEILFFGTIGPLLTFGALRQIGVWLGEKESAQKEADAKERRLASITSASADAILGVDKEGNIDSWNLGASLLLDYSLEEVVGRPLELIFANPKNEEDEFKWLLETVKKNTYVRGYETTCVHSDGHSIDVQLTATSIEDEEGGLLGMSVILRDITERNRREAEIRRLNSKLNQQVAERTQQLGEKLDELARANDELKQLDQHRSELVSLVSHQIRAPLTNVRGAVERMQLDCVTLNPTCTNMFGILQQQVSRLDRLVQDVLDTSRIEAGEFILHREPISPYPVIREVVEEFQARSGNRPIGIVEKPGMPLIFADHDRTAEVLTNLLDNADKFSPPNGRIEIDLGADQSRVTIQVRDTGPGVDAEMLDKVFEKFYRVDSSDSQTAYGYGLGLYLCRLITEAQGGQIWVENHPEGGAIFSFSLPVWREELV